MTMNVNVNMNVTMNVTMNVNMNQEAKKHLKIRNIKSFPQSEKHAEKLTKKSKILENAKVHKTSLCLGAFWGP